MTPCLSARILLAGTVTLTIFCPAPVRGGDVSFAWDPSPDARTIGYNLCYGLASGVYTSNVAVGTNLNALVTGLTPGLMYYFAVMAYDAQGDVSRCSNEVTNEIPAPPSILTQPQSQTVTAGTAASFSSAVTGTAPLSIQWYYGGNAIAGATNGTLGWPGVTVSNAGDYDFTVSNAAGTVLSSIATLTVLPSNISNMFAAVAGAYNGLFFQTNAGGTPAVTEATAGFLGNCIVNSNGTFSAKLYVGGLSHSLAGSFNGSGTASVTIARTSTGLSNLTAVLQLDLTNRTRQMTGAISSATGSNVWTAPLLADLATNALPNLADVSFLVYPGLSLNSPTGYGFVSGTVANSVVSLSGALADNAPISQVVPISKNGNIPLYISLYNNTGLLEGWVNVAGGVVTGNLTWIRPSGITAPAGFPLGFDTVALVSGSTQN